MYIRLLVLQTVGKTGFGSGSSLEVSNLGFLINIEGKIKGKRVKIYTIAP